MTGTAHPLIVDLEEHFQFAPGRRFVAERHWDKFPPRILRNADSCLRLLDRHGARATFLTDDWVAARHPGVIADIVREGHEIACRLSRSGDVLGAKHRLEQAAGQVVMGCCSPPGVIPEFAGPGEFRYECGVSGRTPEARRPDTGLRLAVPSLRLAGQTWPRDSGAVLRQVPDPLLPRYLARWRAGTGPRTFWFKLWELDPDLPQLAILGGLERFVCYRNLRRFPDRLARLLDTAPFEPVRSHFSLTVQRIEPISHPASVASPPPAQAEAGVPVSVVVPCFNEEAGLAYLANALAVLETGLGRRHPLSFVLVDDGSTDATWAEMERLFGQKARVRLVRHDRNRGIGAAILTGIAAAESEIIAVMDSDCSYDPARIEDMLPLFGPDVALVTASPYHTDGGVEGVPEWRLALSRGASWLYRRVLHNKLATYTSCFRICRKSALKGLALRHEGYIGVVEMLARLDLAGWRVVEHPVVLEARLLGRSKLKILRTIAGHLRFLGEICVARLLGRGDGVTKGIW